MKRRGTALTSLQPAWEAEEGRHRMGISLQCPRHPWEEVRPLLWFDNPGDGGPPMDGAQVTALHVEEPEGFESLTLLPSGSAPYDCVRIGHWRGWVADGALTESLITGVAW